MQDPTGATPSPQAAVASWANLMTLFREISALQDPSEKEYRILAAAKKYGIELESLERLFDLFEERSALAKLESHNAILFRAFARLERALHRIHQHLRMMAIFPVLEQLAKLGIVIAAVLFLTECTGRQQQRLSQKLSTHYAAWDVINSHPAHDSSSGGRTEAIEFLSGEGQDLSGINLSNAWLTDIDLSPNWLQRRKPRFLGANFAGAILTNGDLGEVDLTFANFNNAKFHYDHPYAKGFYKTSLRRANFVGADLEGVSFDQSDLRCANFAGVSYLNPSEVKKAAVVKGAETWRLAIYDRAMEARLYDGDPVQHRSRVDLFDLPQAQATPSSSLAMQSVLRLAAVEQRPVMYCYGFMIDHVKPADKQRWVSALKDRFDLFKASRMSQFRGVDLRYAHLEDHDLSGSQLQGANLQDAYLNNTNLDGSDLQGVNLEGVKKLTCHQLARAKNWQLAVFTAAVKDPSQNLFVPVNVSDNQQAIENLRLKCPQLR